MSDSHHRSGNSPAGIRRKAKPRPDLSKLGYDGSEPSMVALRKLSRFGSLVNLR